MVAIVTGGNFAYKLCISTYVSDIFANHFPDATVFPQTQTTTLPAIGTIPSDAWHSQILCSHIQRNHEWWWMNISLPYTAKTNLYIP